MNMSQELGIKIIIITIIGVVGLLFISLGIKVQSKFSIITGGALVIIDILLAVAFF